MPGDWLLVEILDGGQTSAVGAVRPTRGRHLALRGRGVRSRGLDRLNQFVTVGSQTRRSHVATDGKARGRAPVTTCFAWITAVERCPSLQTQTPRSGRRGNPRLRRPVVWHGDKVADFPPSPWSKKQLGRLGECLRDGTPVPAHLPDYGTVLLWYAEVAAWAHATVQSIDVTEAVGRAVALNITSRVKSEDTLREKLQRMPNHKLPNVRDIAGVRVVCQATLSEQDLIGEAIRDAFGRETAYVVDRRSDPRGGYRALHVEANHLGWPVEIQVRTAMQAEWADAYERVADVWGRQIRYGESPDADPSGKIDRVAVIHDLQQLSLQGFAEIEGAEDMLVDVRRAMAELQLPATAPSGLVQEMLQHEQQMADIDLRLARSRESSLAAIRTVVNQLLDL